MPIADAHVHILAGGYEGAMGQLPAGMENGLVLYERFREHYDIHRSLVVGYEGLLRFAGTNACILKLAATHQWMSPQPYIAGSTIPTVEYVREMFHRGAVGFAVYVLDEKDAQGFCSWPDAVFETLKEMGAILTINLRMPQLSMIAPAMEKLCGCPVLFSHLAQPGRFSEAPSKQEAACGLAPLIKYAAHPNVYVKFSGLGYLVVPAYDFPYRVAQPFVDAILNAFGTSRVVWGSDFPMAMDFATFPQLLETRLLSHCTNAEIDAIMGGNLLRLLNERDNTFLKKER